MKDILFLEPHFGHYIWGGTKLRTEFHYDIEGDDIGECWGIAAHENGASVVKGHGCTLTEYYREHPEDFGMPESQKFPLLIKIIDAKTDLSIQVHPDDAYAKENENGSLGKTECWYVLDCPEHASLVVGHNAESRDELREMVEKEAWKELIREVPVAPGDFIQIDPGTVHAIKGGLLILETQQNSDITYRLYDYDRVGKDGKKRPLHIRQSIDVITCPAPPAEEQIIRAAEISKRMKENELFTLLTSDKYTVFLLQVNGTAAVSQDYPFLNMTVTEGEGTVNGTKIGKGDHFIIPNGFGEVSFSGQLKLVASTVQGF